jgi:uncharacterized protein YcnI
MIRSFMRAAAAGAILSACVVPAFAHVTLQVPEAAVAGGYKAVLRVPHGCKGSATTAIKVKVPEGYLSAKPQPKPGWSLDIKTGDYAKSYTLYGSKVTSGAVEIGWSGGNLPDNEYDEFALNGTLAGDLKPGDKMYFPVIQTCESGEEDWIQIPVDGQAEPETPAPGLTLLPAAGSDD